MLFAVIGTSAGKSRDSIMSVYPRHKAFLDPFVARGEVVGVGPFLDPGGGNMALFRTRAAAEAFVKGESDGPTLLRPSIHHEVLRPPVGHLEDGPEEQRITTARIPLCQEFAKRKRPQPS